MRRGRRGAFRRSREPPRPQRPAVWGRAPSFFFSSRRRHTRFDCDWSSDVCPSDLLSSVSVWSGEGLDAGALGLTAVAWIAFTQLASAGVGGYLAGRLRTRWQGVHTDEVYFRDKIGRASCRERV